VDTGLSAVRAGLTFVTARLPARSMRHNRGVDSPTPATVNPYSPPAAALDPHAPPPATADYRPLRGLATALTVVLVAYVVSCVALIANDAFTIMLMDQLLERQHVAQSSLIGVDERERLLRFVLIGIRLTTAVLFCLIMPRASRNARGFGRMSMTITPGWAAGYFFVPILSLWMPLVAMQEIWRASEPNPDPRIATASLPVPDLLWIWWAGFLIQSTGSLVLTKISPSNATTLMQKCWADIMVLALTIGSVVLCMAVVRALARRQDDCQAAITRAALGQAL
jgi:hypothetical protein